MCMVGPKSIPLTKTDVGQCFQALTSSAPEMTLVDPSSKGDETPPSAFQFSGTTKPHKASHNGQCAERHDESVFPETITHHMPAKVELPHTEVSQQEIKQDCLVTSLKIVREGKTLPSGMQRVFHTYFTAATTWIGRQPGFAQFDNKAGAKVNGHQKFAGEMPARRALSYTLCMLKAGYAVPMGVSYLNSKSSNTGVNHWIVAYGYEFVPRKEGGYHLKILAHDVGIIKNGKAGDDRHVEFLVDATGRIYKPGVHDRHPAVRGGQEVTAIGMPFEIKSLLPMT